MNLLVVKIWCFSAASGAGPARERRRNRVDHEDHELESQMIILI